MKILFIGDVVCAPGRDYLTRNLNKIKRDLNADLCIANGENSAHGNGATVSTLNDLYMAGVDVITMGNHTFKRDMTQVFDELSYVIRPANLPNTLPGEGYIIYDCGRVRVGIINAIGRVYLDPCDSPFTACKAIIDKIKDDCDIIFVDFHAEATSEKGAMGYYLDGQVAAVVGTHTHIQTADEKILPKGTAFITDVGMTGPVHSILGVKTDIIVDRFVNFTNKKFELGDGKVQFNGVLIDADEKTGLANKIERVAIYE